MRFEDYLDRALYESICQENANKRYREVRHVNKERRREETNRVMLTITMVCFIILFLLMCISYKAQNKQKELVEDLPIEDVIIEPEVEEPVETIEEEVSEDIENEKIQAALIAEANRIDNVVVSYYCAEKYNHICNAGEPYKTALGYDVIPNLTCAVDPNVIPLGSTVFVDYGDGVIHEYFATDTGGAIKQNRIDVAVETHDYALQCGLKNATVWWINQ